MPLPVVPSLFPAAVLFAAGSLVVSLARSVRAGNVQLLSGYDKAWVADKPGLAAWASDNLLVLGSLQLAASLLFAVLPYVGIALFISATLGLAARTALGCARFYR